MQGRKKHRELISNTVADRVDDHVRRWGHRSFVPGNRRNQLLQGTDVRREGGARKNAEQSEVGQDDTGVRHVKGSRDVPQQWLKRRRTSDTVSEVPLELADKVIDKAECGAGTVFPGRHGLAKGFRKRPFLARYPTRWL